VTGYEVQMYRDVSMIAKRLAEISESLKRLADSNEEYVKLLREVKES
jgi:hypothetical protein